MVIGVIDTGVDSTHDRLRGSIIKIIALELTDGKVKINTKYNEEDESGHGTGVVSIINGHIPKGGSFKVVKIGNSLPHINEVLLIKAINILADDAEVQVINISMGIKTNSPSLALEKAVYKANKKGKIIIAASYYDSQYKCYPANFKDVFSVGSGYIKYKEQFKYISGEDSDILAKGGFQRVAIPGNKYQFSVGTSLATAHFTGIVANAFVEKQWFDSESLKQWLIKNSDDNIYSLTRHERGVSQAPIQPLPGNVAIDLNDELNIKSPIDKLALFPVEEKEMQSIIENQDLLSGEIKLLLSYPQPLKKLDAIKNTLNRLPTQEELSEVETIVLGSFTDQQSDYNTIFAIDLVKLCIKLNKNIITWDQTVYQILKELKGNSPNYRGIIELISFNRLKMKKLYSCVESGLFDSVPSLCVIGTNKKQGKFTVQLQLKRLLQEFGYTVGHISSEPQGALLSSNFTFPFGHNSTVSIPVNEWYHVINMLKKIIYESTKCDIIISGSQSGIIPRHPLYSSMPPQKLIYTNAFYPDALVCTISPFDEVDFIKQTVNTVQGYNSCKVIFYSLTPYNIQPIDHQFGMRIKSKKIELDKYKQRLEYYREHLGKPVLNIMDPKNTQLVIELIQKHYSSHESRSAS